MIRLAAYLACAAAFLLNVTTAAAQDKTGFYKDRTINLLIGFGPGGANDVWARTLARHMGRHIPGNPNIVPQNMPGAGTLKLTNYLFAAAPRDGTAFGLINRGIPLEPLLGGAGVQFEPLKMTWIGSPDKDTTVCAARKDSKVQTMKDLFTTDLPVGATGSGADTAVYPEFLSEFFGMRFRTIKGYPGSNEIVLAIERKEVEGICVAYASIARQRLFRDGGLNLLFQAGLEKDPAIPPEVPNVDELAKSEDDRAALRLFLARAALGRPFVGPPGIPADRADILRRAFDATMKDPQFIAEAEKQQLTVDPMTGEQIAKVIEEIYRTPAPVVKRVADILGRLPGK